MPSTTSSRRGPASRSNSRRASSGGMKRSPAPWTIAVADVTTAGDVGRLGRRRPCRRDPHAAAPEQRPPPDRGACQRCGGQRAGAVDAPRRRCADAHDAGDVVRRRVAQHGHAAHRRADRHHGGTELGGQRHRRRDVAHLVGTQRADATAGAVAATVEGDDGEAGAQQRLHRVGDAAMVAVDAEAVHEDDRRDRIGIARAPRRRRQADPSSLDSSPSTRSTFTHGKRRPMPAARLRRRADAGGVEGAGQRSPQRAHHGRALAG